MQMVIQTLIIIVIYFCLFSATRVEVCSLLLAHGADPTLLNCHSKAAVDAAPTKELQEKLSCMFSFLFDLFLLSRPKLISDTMSDIEVAAKTVFELRSKCSMLPLKFLGKWNAWEAEKKIIMPVPSCHFHGVYSYWPLLSTWTIRWEIAQYYYSKK